MIATGAVFLALALGILIGVSFGDSVLVANQRDIIELMEGRLESLKEQSRQQGLELQRWESVKPLLRRGFRERLGGKEFLLVAASEPPAEQLAALLRQSGAAATVVLASPFSRREKGREGVAPPPDAERLIALFSGDERPAAEELERLGLHLQESETDKMALWPPCCCLLLFEEEDSRESALLRRLWQGLHEKGVRVIALFPWHGEERDKGPALPAAVGEPNLIDNIDTFWGQTALLHMLAEEASGYYGFGAGSGQLLPAAGEGD